MHQNTIPPSRRLGQRLVSSACALLTVSLLAALAAPNRAAAQFQSTTISPLTTTVNVGTPFSVNIVAQMHGYISNGIQAWVVFDKTKLQVVSVTTGASSPWTTVFANSFDNTNGTLTYGAKGGGSGGTVTAATIVFNPIAAGTTAIGYSNVNQYIAGSPYGVNGTASGCSVTINAAPVLTVFGSGITPVQTWDPIFPDSAYPDASALSTPTQTVGPLPNDSRWTNPHAAFVFSKGSHPWEFIPPMNFDANWINAWSDLGSRGPAGQSWTKYSTTVTGQGDFVLQFLADNVSWIYIDGALIGYQDWNWGSTSTGRYTIHLTGAGPHELVFVIWDGGGAAGGKFRLETTQSFINNGGGALPPPPAPTDTTAPDITAPSSITKEAMSAAGAVVTFTATANDAVSGSVSVTASPASGSTFAIGISSVTLTAKDAAGNEASARILVTVEDTIAPVLTVPVNQTIEATSAAGATATFVASATDAVGVTSLTYSAASGSTFALGTTTVNVTAKDAANNASTGSFTVTVLDRIAPALAVPVNQTIEATSAAGATATFAASATDAVGVTSLTYSAASGSTFALGTTTVNVTAKDAANNASTGSFTVTVLDRIAPVLTVPVNQTIEATSAAGATATFAASATDAVGVTSLTYSAASGSTFALGTTTVNVTAKDAANNASTGSFTITVLDTIAPALTAPANQTIEATSAAGATATFAASATDAVGVTSLTYSAASGSSFALGTTTVNVTAKDAANNTSNGSFTITVQDTTAPTITSVSTNAPTLWPPNHKMVAVTVRAAASDTVSPVSLKIYSVTSDEPDNGLGDGDTPNDIQYTGAAGDLTVNLRAERSGGGSGRTYAIVVQAMDAAGNTTLGSCKVFVPKSQSGK